MHIHLKEINQEVLGLFFRGLLFVYGIRSLHFIRNALFTYFLIFCADASAGILNNISSPTSSVIGGAYALRKLNSKYSGPLIKVRRGSDSAVADIYPNNIGDLDDSSLISFIGNSSGYVVTWYDQSGNNGNATQSTAANQPIIADAGSVYFKGNHPAINFSGNQWLVIPGTSLALNTDQTYMIVFSTTSNGPPSVLPDTWYNAIGIIGGEQPGIVSDFGIGIDRYGDIIWGTGDPSHSPKVDVGIITNTTFSSGNQSIVQLQRLVSDGSAAIYASGFPVTSGDNKLAPGPRSSVTNGLLGAMSFTNSTISGGLTGTISELITFGINVGPADFYTVVRNQDRYFGILTNITQQDRLSVSLSPSVLKVSQAASLSTSGGSGVGGISYELISGPCTISGNMITGIAPGICSVNAIKAGDITYSEAIANASFMVEFAPQNSLIIASNPSVITVGSSSRLSASGGSGSGNVTYGLQSGPCTLSADILTGVAQGECLVYAIKAADTRYGSVTSNLISVMVGLAPQSSLSVTSSPSSINVGQTSTLSSVGGSGDGTVSYSVLSGPCSISGETLTGVAQGVCEVTASKAGDTSYASVTSESVSVMVGLAPQSSLILAATPSTINVGQTSTLSSLGGSGSGTVSYSVLSGPCSISGATLTGVAQGVCEVKASKAADASYASMTSETLSVMVGLAPQSALIVAATPSTINVGQTSTLSSLGGSGSGTVSYAVLSGPCSISGATLTGLAQGVCEITASKAGDTSYASMTSESLSVMVGLAPQSALIVAATPSTINVGQTSPLSSVGGSGSGSVSYSVLSGPCSISGSTLTGIAHGVCEVTAMKAGNSTYASATSQHLTVIVGVAPQTALVVTASPSTIYVGQTSTLSSVGGSGTGSVSYAVQSGPCSISAATLTGIAQGICEVTAIKSGNATYAPATSAPLKVMIGVSPQTALVAMVNPSLINVGQQSALTTTGGSGTGTVMFNVVSGPCSITGTALTGIATGVCQISAFKAGDKTYAPVTSNPISVMVGLSSQLDLYVNATPSNLKVGQSSILSVVGGSGTGTVLFKVISGPCSITGSSLLGIADGQCQVLSIKSSDATYGSIISNTITVSVSQVDQSPLYLTVNPSTISMGSTAAINVTGGSGAGSVIAIVKSGPCVVNGYQLTGISDGECVVEAIKTSDDSYASITSRPFMLTVVAPGDDHSPSNDVPISSGIQVKAGLNIANINWSNLNEQNVRRHVVTSMPDGKKCESKGVACTIKGLREGVHYSFVVTTIFKDGNKKYSSPTSTLLVRREKQTSPLKLVVTPTQLGGVFTLDASGGNGQGAISFSAHPLSAGDHCAVMNNVVFVNAMWMKVGNKQYTNPDSGCFIKAIKAGDLFYEKTTSQVEVVKRKQR